ncbi:hypothetical protein [Aliiroseovarius crassostreae]|uniref:hypothetical protein n=1 Tax=Aliiroseovarius crassostreae TaxID=154981 RepID=UPI003C7E96B2
MDLHMQTARLAQMMEERLDIRGADFATKIRRAGRLLPRHVRREAALLISALPMMDHPHLSRQVEVERLARAVKIVEDHLLDVDPWDRRIGIVVNWAAGLAFSLLLVAGLCLWLLHWQGFL